MGTHKNKSTAGSGKQAPAQKTTVHNAKTVDELKTALYNDYSIRLNDSKLGNVPFDNLQMAVQGVTTIIDEFPQAASSFHEINGDDTNGYAHAKYSGEIAINPSYYQSSNKINTTYDRDVSTRFHPEGTSASSITSHEAGHLLERALIDKHVSDDRGPAFDHYAKGQAWNKGTCASKIISEAAKNAKKTSEGKGKTISTLISDVSRYASRKRSEALAECVADYVSNREKAKPLSREVWKILKRELG